MKINRRNFLCGFAGISGSALVASAAGLPTFALNREEDDENELGDLPSPEDSADRHELPPAR